MSVSIAAFIFVVLAGDQPGPGGASTTEPHRAFAQTLVPKRGSFKSEFTEPAAKIATGQKSFAVEQFSKLPRQEQQQILNQLPLSRRQKVEEELKAYHNLPATEKQRLNQQYERFKSLPPQRQEEIRKAYDHFSQVPPQRQQAIRDELKLLANASPLQKKRHLQSKKFKKGFSKEEQTTIEGLLAAPHEEEE